MKRKEENNKNKNPINLGHMVAPVHNCNPKNIAGSISEAAMGGVGGREPHIS